jgi:hypothetical protein
MKLLLCSMLVLCSCATLSDLGTQYEYCGNVDTLQVFVQSGSQIGCRDAMSVTNSAYELLWQRAAGPLNESWRVEFIHEPIDISDPWARTYPYSHLIQVQSEAPTSIFHELGHAYMDENHSGGLSQHRTMCSNPVWRRLENDFGVKPYCHLVN